MVEITAKLYAGLIIILAIIGIIWGDGKFLNFLNIDGALDMLRIALGVLLLNSVYGAVRGSSAQRLALSIVGVVYIAIGIWGFFSGTAGGLLPSEMTLFDKLFHLITGVGALSVGLYGFSPSYRPTR